ncbi:MAG TPA: YfhO family protein [Thermoanaerobaculia bacterium]
MLGALTAPLLYAATAGALLWATHRWLVPLERRIAILLALLPLLFTGPALLTGRVYAPVDIPYAAPPLKAHAAEVGLERTQNGTLSDVYSQIIPWKKAVRDAWRHGEWPLWNPYMFAGDILAGSAQAAPYDPFFLVSCLLPMAVSLTYLATITLFIGGLWMHAWLRELGCRDDAALLGAAGWMFGDFLVFWLEWPLGATFRWTPLVFLGVRRLVRERDAKATVVLALAFALMILAGHPESVLHVVAVGAIYGIWELLAVRPPGIVKVVLRSVVAGTLAIAATAIFMLPILEALPQTAQHALRQEFFANSKRSLAPAVVGAQLAANFVPFRYGWAREDIAEGAPFHPVPWSAYGGSLLFPLAIYGLVASKRRERWLMLGLAIFGWLAGNDAPVVADLLAKLPLFDIAINNRLIYAALFATATLAALGAEAWLERGRSGAVALLVAGALAVLGAAVAFAWPDMRAADLEPAFLWKETGFLLAPLLLGALAITLVRAPRPALAIVILLLLGQRALEVGDEYPTLPRAAFYPPFSGLEILRQEGPPFRIVGLHYTLIPQTATMYGLEDVRGYQAMTHEQFNGVIPLYSVPSNWFNIQGDLSMPFLSFLNVRYAIVEPNLDAPAGWRRVASAPDGQIYENTRVLPRAYIPPRIRINIPPERVVGEMQGETDFGQRAWIHHPTGGAAPDEFTNGRGRVSIARDGMSAFKLTADMRTRGWIVVSEVFWHGWHAYEGGTRIPLRQANHAFIGLFLEAGHHEIELSYTPLSFYWGAAISFLTIAGAVAWGLWRRRRRRPEIAS